MSRSGMTEHADSARPIRVVAGAGRLWVELEDGRVIGVPIDWYLSLRNATSEELSNYELLSDSVYWPDLDEDLSIRGMLRGVCPHYPWTAEEWRERADSIKALTTRYGEEATLLLPIQMTDPFDARVTVKEIAEQHGLSTDAVYQAIRRKRLPAQRSGATWLVRRRDAQELWGSPPPSQSGEDRQATS